MITAPPIAHERFYYESVFKDWVIQNAKRLVEHRSEIFEHGLCVVTKIWATEDCAIHVWDEAGKEIKVGFDVGVDAIGDLGPGVGWSFNHKDGGWMRYKSSKVRLYEVLPMTQLMRFQIDQGLVVFFDGLRIKSRKIPLHGVSQYTPSQMIPLLKEIDSQADAKDLY